MKVIGEFKILTLKFNSKFKRTKRKKKTTKKKQQKTNPDWSHFADLGILVISDQFNDPITNGICYGFSIEINK